MIGIKKWGITQVMPAHLSFGEVIGQVVEKFVKHLKPWKITAMTGMENTEKLSLA